MTNQLTSLQCPGCGGLLRSLDARVWQCAYCESRYALRGEADPELDLARSDNWYGAPKHLSGDCWPTHISVDEKDPWAGVIMCSPDEAKALQAAWPMPHVRTNEDCRSFWRARKGRRSEVMKCTS